jgi:hypothetical protein
MNEYMNGGDGTSLDTDRDRAIGERIGGASGEAACPDFVESVEPLEVDPRAPRQIAKDHCAKFERGLNDWSVFEDAARSEPHWFKDLLSLWRPSGHCSGADGLRVAIRNDYLNFYRLGQSIARVACLSGELIADVHYKYVLGEQYEYSGPLYLRLTTQGVFSRGALVAPYDGPSTLHQWIAVAGEYAGDEKSIVDELVEKNDHVVDLEMAIPAWAFSKVAVRMDLVAIEDGKVVFWEAKTVNDGRIRCEAEFLADKFPHVLEQLSNYRIFLEQDRHVEQVERAYRNTAGLLVRLRALADEIGPTLALGRSIIAASQAHRLEVAPLAALVVVDLPADNKRAWTSWKASHEGKLLGKIPMRVLERPGPLVFAGAQ